MFNEKILIAQIGLTQTDLRMVQAVFNLSADVKKRFEFHEQELSSADADIVLVNVDNDMAMQTWRDVHSGKKRATPIMVTSNVINTDDMVFLSRPLSLKKILSVLESVTTTTKTRAAEHNAMSALVVDDSFSVRKYMEQKLPELAPGSISVDFASSGEEAIEKVRGNSYGMIFLDVVMGGVDGYQVCKWIKSECPTYVVMLTSKKSPFDKVRGSMSGCDDFITKPPQDKRLVKVLNKVFDDFQKTHEKEYFDAYSGDHHMLT